MRGVWGGIVLLISRYRLEIWCRDYWWVFGAHTYRILADIVNHKHMWFFYSKDSGAMVSGDSMLISALLCYQNDEVKYREEIAMS